MDAEDLHSGDYLSVAIFTTLQKCKAIVPIVTRGYAQSLWCMRELYYAKLTESAQILPVVIEDGWQREDVGRWLEGVLGEVKYISVRDQDVKGVALKIAEVGHLMHNNKMVIRSNILQNLMVFFAITGFGKEFWL